MKYLQYGLSIAAAFLLCVGFAYAVDLKRDKDTAWRLVKKSDGIVVYAQRKVTGSRFKGTGRVTVNDLYSPIAMMEDYEAMPKWLALMSKVTELNRDDDKNRYIHSVVKFPVIKDRDLVYKVVVSQDPKTRSVTAEIQNQYHYIPLDPEYIRFLGIDGFIKFDVVSETEIDVTFELEVNLSGLVSANFADYLLMYAPYMTILNMRDALKDPKYHNQGEHISIVSF